MGLDLSERQLGHANRLITEAGVDVRVLQASARLICCSTNSVPYVPAAPERPLNRRLWSGSLPN
jgi:hypothetical protein